MTAPAKCSVKIEHGGPCQLDASLVPVLLIPLPMEFGNRNMYMVHLEAPFCHMCTLDVKPEHLLTDPDWAKICDVMALHNFAMPDRSKVRIWWDIMPKVSA